MVRNVQGLGRPCAKNLRNACGPMIMIGLMPSRSSSEFAPYFLYLAPFPEITILIDSNRIARSNASDMFFI